MSDALWICPDQIFDGESLVTGIALGLEDGRSTRILPLAALEPTARRKVVRGTLVPGFLDLQVNGGGDVLFNTQPDVAGIAAIAAAHRRFGTVGLLPTLITDAPEVMTRAADAAIAAQSGPMAGRDFLGVHLEGPHLSVARKGTHRADLIRPLDEATIAEATRLRAAGVTVMLTLAPESVRPGQVRRLVEMGCIVSIGHTDATAEAVRALLDEGANCFTHLYNAMSPMQSRAPGVTGAAINSTAWVGIICDGIHVLDEMVGLALRARPLPDRTFLVSDAMPTVGGSDVFRLYGNEIRVVDGRLVNAEGSLAGAHVTMAESLRRLIVTVGVDAAAALRMSSTIPARVINRPELGRPEGRDARDLLVLDTDWQVAGTLAEIAQDRPD